MWTSCADFVREAGAAVFSTMWNRRPERSLATSDASLGQTKRSNTVSSYTGRLPTRRLAVERPSGGPARSCFGTDSHTCHGGGRSNQFRHRHWEYRTRGSSSGTGLNLLIKSARDDALLSRRRAPAGAVRWRRDVIPARPIGDNRFSTARPIARCNGKAPGVNAMGMGRPP